MDQTAMFPLERVVQSRTVRRTTAWQNNMTRTQHTDTISVSRVRREGREGGRGGEPMSIQQQQQQQRQQQQPRQQRPQRSEDTFIHSFRTIIHPHSTNNLTLCASMVAIVVLYKITHLPHTAETKKHQHTVKRTMKSTVKRTVLLPWYYLDLDLDLDRDCERVTLVDFSSFGRLSLHFASS